MRPMPVAPPVTSTVLPFTPNSEPTCSVASRHRQHSVFYTHTNTSEAAKASIRMYISLTPEGGGRARLDDRLRCAYPGETR
jgi:hypothetical protein